MEKKKFRVVWEIEVEADCPLEAAKEARRHQSPFTSALVFSVFNTQVVEVTEEEIDLELTDWNEECLEREFH